MELATKIAMHGRLTLYLFDADLAPRYELARLARERGQILQRASSNNLLVTGGLSMFALAVNWAFTQNDNSALGAAYTSAQGNLGELYAAVGTGVTAAAASQVQLVTEVGRGTISAAAVTANVLVYDFFLGQSSANGVLSEAGLFMQASATVNSGTMFDRSVFAVTTTKSSANTAILEFQLTITSG